MRVLQRVVLPADRDLDVLKLYVEGRGGRGEAAAAGPGQREVRVAGRRSAAVAPGGRASF